MGVGWSWGYVCGGKHVGRRPGTRRALARGGHNLVTRVHGCAHRLAHHVRRHLRVRVHKSQLNWIQLNVIELNTIKKNTIKLDTIKLTYS